MTSLPLGIRSPLPTAAPAIEERWAESRAPLVERLRDRILADGPVTFADFMAAALYDPVDGYYVTRPDRATRDGDFLTAPEMDPLFGAALAGHLVDGWERLGRPDPFVLREDGAGSGALAVAILGELRRAGAPLLAALRYRPVEVAPSREVAIRERLAADGFGDHLEGPGASKRLIGAVIANELLDALPVHRVIRGQGAIVELRVAWRDGWFADEPCEPADPALAALLAASGIELREGDRAEVSLAAPAWVRAAASVLERGWLLVIDYGGAGRDLWGAAHPAGQLRTFRAHHAGGDPYRAVGRQDLTAHVDVTALLRAAEAAGLQVLGQATQAEFLAGLEVGELLVMLGRDPATGAARYRTARGALLRLLDPAAMGRFAVVAVGRGMAQEPALRGFGFSLAGR